MFFFFWRGVGAFFGEGGMRARVSELFYKDSKSKLKKIFFFKESKTKKILLGGWGRGLE